MDELTPERIAAGLTYYVVLLFSLSVHESAHAWTALRMGDDTAARQGRITLNPLPHIDPIGTLLMPLLQMLTSGLPLLAWAKPTPVVAANFRAGWFRRGQVLTAAAGPASNGVLALIFTAGLFVARRLPLSAALEEPLKELLLTGILLNVALGIFNLVPLPPLDGSWVASWGLPRPLGQLYDRLIEPYGAWLLLIAFATGLLGFVTGPPMRLLSRALVGLAS